jgi:hypothetical protein
VARARVPDARRLVLPDDDCTPVICGDGHANVATGEQCVMAVRFLVSRLTPGFPRAHDLAKVSRPRAPRCLPARSVLTRALKFPLQNA